ncbi:MAG: hypothetical protein IPK33_21770 [Gemmatimonadetes bacterium]|nr:hypothetical protein [Gemmatimonadota bacterium]MBK9411147.1 hypothetical protein [Gemmatimonadota bacterium]
MSDPHAPPPPDPDSAAPFRRTLVRVMGMQLLALLALWWLQSRYAR